MREIDSVPVGSRPPPKEGKLSKTKGREEKKNEEQEGRKAEEPSRPIESEGAMAAVAARCISKEFCRISAVTTMTGVVSVPWRALAKQHRDGPLKARDRDNITLKQAEKIGADADPKRRAEQQETLNSTLFLTSVNSGSAGTTPSNSKATTAAQLAAAAAEEEEELEPLDEFSGSETDGDADEQVGWRYSSRPASPRLPADPNVDLTLFAPRLVEGSSLLFFGDTSGWIWCIDVASTVKTAVEKTPPITVILDPAAARAQTAKSRGPNCGVRGSVRVVSREAGSVVSGSTSLGGSLGGGNITGALGATFGRTGTEGGIDKSILRPSHPDDGGPVLSRPLHSILAQPEDINVVGAWPAHLAPITSLVPVASPPALVSTDTEKEVKVWSTAGDLWGHFSLRGVDGAQPPVAVWPPPHVLALQVSLMRTSKALCRRMGFHITKEDVIKAKEAKIKQQNKAARERRERRRAQEKAAAAASDPLDSPGATKSRPLGRATSTKSLDVSATLEDDAATTLGPNEMLRAVAEVGQDGQPSAPALPEDVEDGAPPMSPGGEPQSPGADTEGGSDLGATITRRRKKNFTSAQLSEMVRNHAFSGGCRTYKQYSRKAVPEHKPRSDSAMAQLEAQRRLFFDREADAFGVELLPGSREEGAWENATRGLGPRSASEGALLRYAHGAVEDMTRSVHAELGIDVTRISKKQLRRPSFASRLDIGGVSANPCDATSATGQAVRRLCKRESQQSQSAVSLPPVSPERGGMSSTGGPGGGRARGRR